jgi:uncharacterized membrane protein
MEPQTDDAPVATAKHGDSAALFGDALPDAKGNTILARSITINRPLAEVFGYFRDFSKLPTFMENVVSIDIYDPLRSHWVVKAPGGRTVEWDARITDEADGRFIAWTSDPGADVANSGRVDFRDAGERGTVVTATILYDPPAGIIGKVIAKMFQREPGIQARRDLRRLKQLLEAGEIATAARTKAQHEKDS